LSTTATTATEMETLRQIQETSCKPYPNVPHHRPPPRSPHRPHLIAHVVHPRVPLSPQTLRHQNARLGFCSRFWLSSSLSFSQANAQNFLSWSFKPVGRVPGSNPGLAPGIKDLTRLVWPEAIGYPPWGESAPLLVPW
jgi:hypothetical protein